MQAWLTKVLLIKDLVEFLKWNKKSVLLNGSRNNFIYMTQSCEWSKLKVSSRLQTFWIVIEIMAVKFMSYFEEGILRSIKKNTLH